MKKFIASSLSMLVFGFMIMSCQDENPSQSGTNGPISGSLISRSDCKSGLKQADADIIADDSLSCVEYTYNSEDKKLSLTHINAGFNCCPDSVYAKISVKGDTIFIEEIEKSAMCDCNCLYDLNIELNGVEANTYRIKFIEPYASELPALDFEVDLAYETSGSVCVTRLSYPWGMY